MAVGEPAAQLVAVRSGAAVSNFYVGPEVVVGGVSAQNPQHLACIKRLGKSQAKAAFRAVDHASSRFPLGTIRFGHQDRGGVAISSRSSPPAAQFRGHRGGKVGAGWLRPGFSILASATALVYDAQSEQHQSVDQDPDQQKDHHIAAEEARHDESSKKEN